MNLTINELLQGKATIYKGDIYLSTQEYVTPFLNEMSKYTDNFDIQVRLANQVSLTSENTNIKQDTVYNRVWIQAILPEKNGYENYQQTINMVYGIDTRKPVVKFFKGAIYTSSGGLVIFNPNSLIIQELNPECRIDYSPLTTIIQRPSEIKEITNKLKEISFAFNEAQVNYYLGFWIRNVLYNSYGSELDKVKIATSTPIDVYKLLYQNRNSQYYVGTGKSVSLFNVYNAFIDVLYNKDNKDIINKAEKTLLLRQILNF